MKRILYLSVAIFTFLCGYILTEFQIIYTEPPTVKVDKPSNSTVILKEKPLLDGIVETVRGCGNGYGQGYELPDGTKLGEGNSCYSSFGEAKREMAVWLGKSESIIERVALLTHKGEPKSERVVASFPVDEFGHRWVRVMWVEGTCIHYVNGPSLEYALELEKSKYNPYKFEE
jgi:hypothetical protein